MSDITTHYGGSVVAVAGKGCVGIIADHRLGAGYIAVSKSFNRIHEITPRIFVGFADFLPDGQQLLKELRMRVKLFRLNEERDIEPDEVANLLSYILYSKRNMPYYTAPIVAGLSSDGRPYITGMDGLGCMSNPETFVVAGTAQNNLAGMCQALYTEDMNHEELFTMCGQAFLNALGRDAFSGWGARCIILTPEKQIVREVQGVSD